MSLPDAVRVEPESEPEPGSVLCLPEPSQWSQVWVYVFLSAVSIVTPFLPVQSHSRSNFSPEQEHVRVLVLFGSMALLSLALAAWLAVGIRRGFIVADAVGIRWRDAVRIHEAKWEDVRDYYFASPMRRPAYIVETAAGRLSFSAGWWSNARDLTRLIELHALDASPREWRMRVRVPFEKDVWPRRFSYRTFENLCVMPPCILLLPALLACLVGNSPQGVRGVGANLSQISDLYGWPLTLLMITPPVLMFVGLPLVCSILGFHGWRDSRRRWNESIEATREGISWTDGESTIASTWSEVRGFSNLHRKGLALPLYEVQTERGSFRFTNALGGSQRLLLLLQEHAPNIPPSAWRSQESSVQEPPIWNGSERVFHYCNSSIRLLAWGATLMLLVPLAMVWIQSTVSGADPDFPAPAMPWPLAMLCALPIPWLWWRYKSAGIRTDERGITQASWRGERFLAWESISKYLLGSEGALIVEGHDASGQPVRLHFFSSINGADELLDEIERRAIHASNREWSHRSTHIGTSTR